MPKMAQQVRSGCAKNGKKAPSIQLKVMMIMYHHFFLSCKPLEFQGITKKKHVRWKFGTYLVIIIAAFMKQQQNED